jgi:threonine/homoserine/homoserine lactone efflux protein
MMHGKGADPPGVVRGDREPCEALARDAVGEVVGRLELPSERLIAISQMLAALTLGSFAGSAIASRATTESPRSSLSHHNSSGVAYADGRGVPTVTELLAFIGVSLVVIVTPGPDTALMLRNTLLGGRRAGLLTAAGVASGQACWTLAASAGIAALLAASEPVFLAVKLAGAAYLVVLGAQALRVALRRAPLTGDDAGPGQQRLAPWIAYRQGLVSDLGNPKMAAFFTSLLPQFAPTHGSRFVTLAGLGLLFCVLTFTWLAIAAALSAKVGDVLRRERVRRAVEGVTGAVLMGLGVRIALERRAAG